MGPDSSLSCSQEKGISILRDITPVHAFACYFLKIHSNIIHSPTPANPPNTKLDWRK